MSTDAFTLSAISSRSHWAMGGDHSGRTGAPEGVLVSMVSCNEMRSASQSRKMSAKSSSSLVLRASRASLEKMRPVM